MRELIAAARRLQSLEPSEAPRSTRQQSAPARCLARSGVAASLLIASAACGGEAAPGLEMAGAGRFSLEGDFVPIEKSEPPLAARDLPPIAADRVSLAGLPASGSDFYLAIKRSVLGERWFLAAFMKQFYPGNAGSLGDGDFGTRVVSFVERGDRLLVFDNSDRIKASEVGDPQVLIEAYPIVRAPEFAALSNAAEYVLIDPSQGLNEFSVSGSVYNDPYLLPQITGTPLRVGLSFTQNVRVLPDGVAFEEVFAGDVGQEDTPVWGTLGLTLRRYSEGKGFAPTAAPPAPYYFVSDPRLVPDSGGVVAQDPVHWNFHPGMEPVPFYVSAGARRAQADNPDADLIGALRRGIEGWNDVFGYRALEAVFLEEDEILDNDKSMLIVDYPGEDLGFAFASWRTNPNTGEVRGGSVYMSGVFFDFSFFQDPPAEEDPVSQLSDPQPFELGRRTPTFGWSGLTTTSHLCDLPAHPRRPMHGPPPEDPPPLSADQQGVRYVQHVTAHEIGHLLGLRHNFKGSLVPPTSSVMEYAIDEDSVAQPAPGPYDVEAIQYLYQLSPDLPTLPFCTDDDTALDPLCLRFDSGTDPLRDWYSPLQALAIDLVFDGVIGPEVLDFVPLNEVLGFARDGADSSLVPPEERSEALRIALGRAAVPLAAEDAANPAAVAAANGVAEFVLRRAALDPVELRGDIAFDLSDAGALATLSDQAGRLLANEDGVRSFALRRTAVDVLHALQDDVALVALVEARGALERERASEGVPSADLPLLDDLIVRASAALTPYFE
jgi:hypothetical protein